MQGTLTRRRVSRMKIKKGLGAVFPLIINAVTYPLSLDEVDDAVLNRDIRWLGTL